MQSPEALNVQEGDSVVLNCSYTGVTGLMVKQSPPDLSLQEGLSCTLQCSFSTSVTRVQWFRQNPGGHLIHLFYIPSGTKQNGRLRSTTVVEDRRSLLYISSSRTTDSAIYFCAG
uniref:Ig-like domain-containing protein n=1 Tax=Felis catus TaxID=9685 RepID=A0ABI7YRV4_FELCA